MFLCVPLDEVERLHHRIVKTGVSDRDIVTKQEDSGDEGQRFPFVLPIGYEPIISEDFPEGSWGSGNGLFSRPRFNNGKFLFWGHDFFS
jgi:hypothetical protein